MNEIVISTSTLVGIEYQDPDDPPRPSGDTAYVIYWPGVLEIPWPEGMTAREAVAAWKGVAP